MKFIKSNKLATYLDPDHRKWLSKEEIDDVERELALIYPLPVRRSMRGTRRSQLVSTEEMPEESFTIESDDDDVFCADKFAKKMG